MMPHCASPQTRAGNTVQQVALLCLATDFPAVEHGSLKQLVDNDQATSIAACWEKAFEYVDPHFVHAKLVLVNLIDSKMDD